METYSAPADTARIPVLLVEDNTGMSDLLISILKRKGCDCYVERSAHSVLEIAKQLQPALIICDIRLLGKMSGLDVAHSLRADPDVAHIPLLALSGNSSQEDRQCAFDAGFDVFFPKPFPFVELISSIDRYIKAYVAASRT